MAADYVEFYPSQEYIDKNWAPVKMPLSSFNSLAKSQAIAEKKGILAPETTKYYLPSALTEGRFGDYGVNEVAVNYGTPITKDVKDVLATEQDYKQQLMALFRNQSQIPKGIDISKTGAELKKQRQAYGDASTDESLWPGNESQKRLREVASSLGVDHLVSPKILKIKQGDTLADSKYDMYDPKDTSSLDERAALKTLAVANKYHESGGKANGLKLWELYNGAGPKAREYVKKVQHADEMMTHPANKDMYNAYLKLVEEHKKAK